MQRERGKHLAWEALNTLFVQYRAVNVVVLYATDAFSYDIYTGDPYHGDKVQCGKMKALSIGKCFHGKLTDRKLTAGHLMVDKVPQEMRQCVFNFCARVQEPFVNEGCMDGLEIEIMNFLKAEMGFEIKTTCSKLDRGEPYENGTWSDLLGKVRDDSCDIIAGAFFPDHEVHAVFAATDFYLQDFYTFYVQKAPLAPRWKGLVTIFKIKAWTAFAVVLIISWISWYIFGLISGESYQHHQLLLTFMNVWAVSLGISANNRPAYSTLRMFFSFLALYALTITAIYTSKLITVFTHPKYDHQVDSIEEILESGMPIGGRLENRDWFDNGDELDGMVYERYNYSDEFRPSTESLHEIEDGHMALLISRLYVGSNKHRNDIFGLSQSMFANHLGKMRKIKFGHFTSLCVCFPEMIVERGFPLLRRMNNIIATLRDMGYMDKLFTDFYFKMTILTSIREMKAHENVEDFVIDELNDDDSSNQDFNFATDKPQKNESPEIVLTVAHLEGAFSLLSKHKICFYRT